MIPRKIHFIWLGSPLPRWVEGLIIKRWRELNPNFQVLIHREEVLEFCSQKYRDMYNRLEDVCSKSDILRLAVLRKEGGWYFDCDFVPLRPIEELYRAYDMSKGCFLTKQWEVGAKRIANGIIGISKDAEVWKEIDLAFEEISRGDLERTSFGPLLTTRVVTRSPFVTVGRVKDFYPVRFQKDTRPLLESLVKRNYSKEAKDGIFKDLNPYMFHLWLGGKKYNQPELNNLVEKEPQQKQVSKGGELLQIVCMLHKDGIFTAEHVNKLYKSVKEHLHINYEFVCITSNPKGVECKTIRFKHKWPLQWSKIELFRKGVCKVDARVVYMDLDTKIVGNIDCLSGTSCGFAVPQKGSGLGMLMWKGDYSVIYDAFLLEEEKLVSRSSSNSEEFIRTHVVANFGIPCEIQSEVQGIVSEINRMDDARIVYGAI